MKDDIVLVIAASVALLCLFGAGVAIGSGNHEKDTACIALYTQLKDQAKAITNCDNVRACTFGPKDFQALDKTYDEVKAKCPTLAPNGPVVTLHPADPPQREGGLPSSWRVL